MPLRFQFRLKCTLRHSSSVVSAASASSHVWPRPRARLVLVADKRHFSNDQVSTVHGFNPAKIREDLALLWTNDFPGRGIVDSAEISQRYLESVKWSWMCREMSSNVAGETGAVWIYHGALAACNIRAMDIAVREFAERHIIAEQKHLDVLAAVFKDEGSNNRSLSAKHTRLLPMWRMAGWLLGFVPTLLGRGPWLYHTVDAVETFVEKHYGEQIAYVKKQHPTPEPESSELMRYLVWACADEVHHAEDARRCLLEKHGIRSFEETQGRWTVKLWRFIVDLGSMYAAELARRI
mmetsp:Transcript_11372/g.30338  ORF Transcript_11372/g.30338 Transcript_11372/m.30338 type:complete len:293 (+) Transcript_11372:102-980(+)